MIINEKQICKCLSCRRRFDKSMAITEHYIGGETERFCPYCGSDDLQEVKRGKEARPAY